MAPGLHRILQLQLDLGVTMGFCSLDAALAADLDPLCWLLPRDKLRPHRSRLALGSDWILVSARAALARTDTMTHPSTAFAFYLSALTMNR